MALDTFPAKTVSFSHVSGLTWRAVFLEGGVITDILECDDAGRLSDMVLGVVCPAEFKVDLNRIRAKRRQSRI